MNVSKFETLSNAGLRLITNCCYFCWRPNLVYTLVDRRAFQKTIQHRPCQVTNVTVYQRLRHDELYYLGAEKHACGAIAPPVFHKGAIILCWDNFLQIKMPMPLLTKGDPITT